MDRFLFWQRWILVVCIIIVAFGILFALFSGTALFDFMNQQVNPAFWDAGSVPPDARGFQQWIYAVLGASMAGWGITLIFVARFPFKRKEKWSWNSVLWGMLIWFPIDEYASLYFRVYFNALFNFVVFGAILLPLVMTRKYFIVKAP